MDAPCVATESNHSSASSAQYCSSVSLQKSKYCGAQNSYLYRTPVNPLGSAIDRFSNHRVSLCVLRIQHFTLPRPAPPAPSVIHPASRRNSDEWVSPTTVGAVVVHSCSKAEHGASPTTRTCSPTALRSTRRDGGGKSAESS
jgi:hypothetical protein